ncbi:hypothetical protein BH11PSE5_BH11PSE5_10930 [soil metagenome]
MRTPNWSKRSQDPLAIFLALVVIFGLAVRVARLFTARLWTDEVFSAAVSKESVQDIIALTLRHDSHPPLYYIQLHFWQLISDSDTWLLLNSVIFSFASIFSIFIVLKFLYGTREAYIGGAIFAVLPLEVIFSETLRMYCAENVLAIWMFYIAEKLVRREGKESSNIIWFVALGSMINLIHGFGPMVTFFIITYTFIRLIGEKPGLDLFRKIFYAGLIVGFTTIYSVLVGSMRQTIGLSSSNISGISSELTISLLGFNIPYPSIAGAFLVLPFLLLATFSRPSRMIMFFLFLAPTILMIFISIVVKPVFTFRGTGLFMPFAAISLAVFFGKISCDSPVLWRSQWRNYFAPVSLVALLLILSATSLYNALNYRKGGFEKVSAFWAMRSKPGDAVFVNSFLSDYLGFVRYLPNAGRPTVHDVQAPPPVHWQKIFSRLGPAWVDRLHLLPNANTLTYRNRVVYPWFDSDTALRRSRFWIMQTTRSGCELPNYRVTMRETDGSYSVLLCERSSALRNRPAPPFPGLDSGSVQGNVR